MNTTAAGRPTAKQIEDQAAQVHDRVRRAVDHAAVAGRVPCRGLVSIPAYWPR